jgi:hypothetical protein
MKTNRLFIILFIGMFALANAGFAQDKVYKDGSVWEVSFIRLKSGMEDDYIKSLKTTWKAMQDEGVKAGLILSYKILAGSASSPSDWDMMLMIEYKNLASMEGNEDKWDAISKKVIGGQEAMKTLMENRVNMREIYGQKLLREVVYK